MADLRSTHYIGISDGCIEINFAGEDQGLDGQKFISEDVALAVLAYTMQTTGVDRILMSSSCTWPAEYGRPDFVFDDFIQRLRDVPADQPPPTASLTLTTDGKSALNEMIVLSISHPELLVMIERVHLQRPDAVEEGLVFKWESATVVREGDRFHDRLPEPAVQIVGVKGGEPLTLIALVKHLAETVSELRKPPLMINTEGFDNEGDGPVFVQTLHIEDGKLYLSGDANDGSVGLKPLAIQVHRNRLIVGDIIQGREGWQYGKRAGGDVYVTDVGEYHVRAYHAGRRKLDEFETRRNLMQYGPSSLYLEPRPDPDVDAYDETRPSARFAVISVLLYRNDKHIHLDQRGQEQPDDFLVVTAQRLSSEGRILLDQEAETIRFVHDGMLAGHRCAMRSFPDVVGRMQGGWE